MKSKQNQQNYKNKSISREYEITENYEIYEKFPNYQSFKRRFFKIFKIFKVNGGNWRKWKSENMKTFNRKKIQKYLYFLASSTRCSFLHFLVDNDVAFVAF